MKQTSLIIIVLVLSGLFASILIFGKSHKKIRDTEYPPVPKWEPVIAVDIARIAETFSYYTDKKETFVVFQNGTCVIVDSKSMDFKDEAKKILNQVYNYHPDFNPLLMDDGNYLVEFSQPVFSLVFKDEYVKNSDYINKNYLTGLIKDEVLLNSSSKPNEFDVQGKIGLFARARMFMDAKNPHVKMVWKP